MGVKVASKAIRARFLKIEGRGTLVGAKTGEREGQIEELVGGQKPGPEAPTRSKKERERRKQRKRQERSDVGGSFGVRVIEEEEEVRRENPVKYFLPAVVGNTS